MDDYCHKSPVPMVILCFVWMVAAVAIMSWMDYGTPIQLVAELGHGE